MKREDTIVVPKIRVLEQAAEEEEVYLILRASDELARQTLHFILSQSNITTFALNAPNPVQQHTVHLASGKCSNQTLTKSKTATMLSL